MVINGRNDQTTNRDTALIRLIAKAYLLKTELEAGTVTSLKDFATKYDLPARRLKYLADLPLLWSNQRQYLQFT